MHTYKCVNIHKYTRIYMLSLPFLVSSSVYLLSLCIVDISDSARLVNYYLDGDVLI